MNSAEINKVLVQYAFGREDELMESYIVDGPTAAKVLLGVSEPQWRVIFDYLVFEKNLLFKTVSFCSEFFVEAYVQHGIEHVRAVLDVTDCRYDMMMEPVFEFLAIINEGLKYHVFQYREKYLDILWENGSGFLKKLLRLSDQKYEESYGQVLDVLLNTACTRMFTETHFDNGLRAFSLMYNLGREHRPLVKHKSLLYS